MAHPKSEGDRAGWIRERLDIDFDIYPGPVTYQTTELSHEAARASFASRARDFLATRFAGSRRGPGHPPNLLNMSRYLGGPPAQVNGCIFSVNTKSPGLSVYWSGAYYISPNFFSAPTSPAVGVLQAGTYVFGINGGGYGSTVQWDTNSVCSLPGTSSVSLQY